jgi:UDP-2,3-diacylglucosamine pyrophosphatase LpxH
MRWLFRTLVLSLALIGAGAPAWAQRAPQGRVNPPQGPASIPQGPGNAPQGAANAPPGPGNAPQGPANAPQGPVNALSGVIAVISDLHLGRGERIPGEYDPQEDFQWGEDFVLFLDALHRAGGGGVTLVIAGDMFELWETMEGESDCRETADFGCSEDEARKRMEKIVGAHRVELQALGAFASRGANRVVIVPGNHDAALLFPSVWKLVISASRPSRPLSFQLAAEGRWIAPEANVVVEHGHQFDDANKFDGWPKPMGQAPSGTVRLRSPFGEELVRQFFDPLERKYPVVDNITGGAGVLYGVKSAGLVGSALVFTKFVKLLSLDASRLQFMGFLGDGDLQPPVWNVEAARASAVDFLASALPPEDSTAPLVREVLTHGDTAVSDAAAKTLAEMSEDEIRTICQSRYVAFLQAEEEGIPLAQRPAKCMPIGGNLGYLKQKAVQRLRGSLYYVNQYLANVVENLPELKGKSDQVIFVYGHTHAAMRAVPLRSRFTVFNSGAWQRLISREAVAAKATKYGWTADQVLNKLELKDLPACYSFIWIPLVSGKPADAKLRYWMLEGDTWRFKASCPERETLPPE